MAGGMAATGPIGRDAECTQLDVLLETARAGVSAMLVVRGEAGVGKTSLLEHAASRADGFAILRARGVESEIELPYSALHELARPVLDLLPTLPDPQASALAQALALAGEGPTADRFTTCAATLSLLAAAASERPALVLVDDAQWLDRASAEAIVFAARRLEADGVAFVAAARTGLPTTFDGAGLPELVLRPLDASSCALLAERRFGPQVAKTVVAAVTQACAGNPLALLEMIGALDPDQRRGTLPLEAPLRAGAGIEAAFTRAISGQSEAVRTCLLLAAANDATDTTPVVAALAELGLDAGLLEQAETTGLLALAAGRIEFKHPLVRSVVYHGAEPSARRAAHRALAAALTESALADRRAWHLGASAVAADEEVAALLEETAQRASRRHGYAAAERALERAAALSPAAESRARRYHVAGQMAYRAGRLAPAQALLERALAETADDALQASACLLRARIATRSGSAADARALLVREADRIAATDPETAAELLAEAVVPALRAGAPRDAVAIARRANDLVRPGSSPTPVECLADLMLGTSLLLTGATAEGAGIVAATAASDVELDVFGAEPQLRTYLGFALQLAGDTSRARTVLTAVVDEARAASAPGVLPYALARLGRLELEAGRWMVAETLLEDASELARDTGQDADRGIVLGALAWLAAARGREETCREHARAALTLASELGLGSRLDYGGSAGGLLELGLGRPEAAVTQLEGVVAEARRQGWSDAATPPHRGPNLVEAYVRAGQAEQAAAALAPFREDALRAGRATALAALWRCEGLLAADDGFDEPFERSLDIEVQSPFELARSRLCYGERLRRNRRRVDAREQLRAAAEIFERLAAVPWTQRTLDELRATGETIRHRDARLADDLTPAERRIATLVARGSTNKEVAAQLFVTPKTVEFHLGRIFRKLGVHTRGELGHVLAEQLDELVA